jgi:soluble lytic murein transglycosylase-like protein
MLRAFRYWRVARTIGGLAAAALLLGACTMAGMPTFKPGKPRAVAANVAAQTAEPDPAFLPLAFAAAPASRASGMDGMIAKYSAVYGVPESLIRRVIQRESGYNPKARNGPYLGLMQIRHDTARSMGYAGSAEGLLDADTNLKYAVKYLRGAYLVGGGNPDNAMRHYSRGYYYDAKRMGLLDEVGL